MASVVAIQKGFRVVIAVIVNTVVWRAPTSVKIVGGSCVKVGGGSSGVTSFNNPHTYGQGVSKGGALVAGASRVCIIGECDGSPLLVNNNLNRCGLGLVAMEGLLLNMRTCGQADSHGARHDVTSQGVFTWPSTKAVRALRHGESELRCHKREDMV